MEEPRKRKRSIEEEEAAYEEANSVLKELAVERKKRKEAHSEFVKDGSTIYLTALDFIEKPPPHLLSFRQLMYEDLLENPNSPKTLVSALLTTFCYEETFIAPILRERIKVCLVTENSSSGRFDILDGFTIISPKKESSWGKFHAKLFLLKFPEKLRVVVCSANLVGYDWSSIGQVIWFQDFPSGTYMANSFSTELKKFVATILPKSYNLQAELGINLESYDFSNPKVELIASVPGRHKNINSYGQGRMRALINPHGNAYNNLLLQCSSLGKLNKKVISELCKSFANKSNSQMEIIFPSYKSVENCHLGIGGGGTTFLKEEHYNAKEFPKSNLRDIAPPLVYPQICRHLSHSKVIISHNEYQIDDNTVIYLGSHNLSPSAWGNFEKNGGQLFISNYELGVVFLPKSGTAEMKQDVINKLPFAFPPPEYKPDDQPWFIDKYLV